MKKFIPFIAVLLFAFASCSSGDINGGRYYGTFKNLTNNQYDSGSVSFQFVNEEGTTYFKMNNLVPLIQQNKNIYVGTVEGAVLNDLLVTLPSLDSVNVCEPNEAIRMMDVEAEFKGNSVKSLLNITTTNEKPVTVEFIGYFE